MAKKTVVGAFPDRSKAEQAVSALRYEGFSENEVSLIAKQEAGAQGESKGEDAGFANQDLSEGTTWGAGVGAGAGLLAAAGAIAIPGIGPLLAIGPLAATLGTGAVGGLAGALADYGIPAGESKEIEQEVRQGKVLAVVEADETKASRAQQVLEDEGAENVKVHDR